MPVELGHGFYNLAEASKLTGLKPSRVREWFRGRLSQPHRTPVFRSEYEPVDGDYAISFLDLIELFVAGQLREHGVSLQTLRRVHARMATDLGTSRPFSRRELLSDGKKVFMRGLDGEGRQELVEVLTRQRVFPEVLLPFLKRVAYDEVTRLARRWQIARLVVLDPTICFGKPIVEAGSVPTAALAAAYDANKGDADLVAGWFNVPADHVLAAVDFERNMAA
jgi:uncharacterized protein (DUF433 family)